MWADDWRCWLSCTPGPAPCFTISHSRIERFDQGRVTFRYRDNRSQQLQRVNLSAEEFIRRFFLHVLPRGFVKMRSYALFSAHGADALEQARCLLALESSFK